LRPQTCRMAGTIACNIAAAVLDVFTFTLLIPFLDKLFNQPTRDTGITALQRRVIGPCLDAATPDTLLRNIIIVILAAVTLKNVFVWVAGQLGTQLQEFVT